MSTEGSVDASTGLPVPLVQAVDLSRRHPREPRWLLDHVSLEIHAGERLAVVGPTGSGKSLLLRAIALLDTLDEGELIWQGAKVASNAVPRYRSQVIYLQQRPALFEGTVETNLQRPFDLKQHQHRTYNHERTLELLAQCGREAAFLKLSSRNLSGGESQVVALVRALQLDPTVLLLDEPTAALDATSVQQIEELVTQWLEDRRDDRAVVWVSHSESQQNRVADRVVRMHDGSLQN